VSRILIIGPQGVGKGTQAKALAAELGVEHVSTGDIFRDNVAQETELGRKAQEYMNRGELVPDELTQSMVQAKLEEPGVGSGFLLDGFPRTVAQAEWLNDVLSAKREPVDAVLLLEAPLRVLLDRLTARGREDDTEEVISKRLAIYHSETTPLLELYHDRVVAVNGVGTVEEVRKRALDALEQFFRRSGRDPRVDGS
jgi:adenylate kinase